MSKKISWILVFTLLLSSFGFGAVSYADEKVVGENPYHVEVIMTMGFMDVENTTDFMGEEYIEREQAIKYVLNLMNITSYTDTDKVYFQDVSRFSEYHDMINTAVDLGIVMGDGNGNLRPKDNVTWAEACAMIMRAMGYSFMTQGGATNYNALALEYGLLKGISVSGEFVNRNNFAKMLYNTFSMGIAEKTAFGEKEEYTINEEKSSLSFHDMKMDDGVVMATELATVYYSADLARKGGVVIGLDTYLVGATNVGDYLGYNVEFFYDTADEDEKIIRYAFKKNNEEVTYPLKKDTYTLDGNYLTFWDENDVEQRIEVTPEMSMILNGSSVAYDLSYITNPTYTGEFTLVKNSNSANYDVIFINAFSNDLVSGIDPVNGYIYLKNNRYNGKSYIEMPVYENAYSITVIKNGEEIEYTSLVNDDVISYAINPTGRIVTIYASSQVVSGVLNSDAQRAERILTIGEGQYPLADDYYSEFGIELGTKITAYLNYAGKIVYITAGVVKNYGFVLSTGFSKGADPQGAAKILTASGKAENMMLAKKVKLNQGDYETHANVINALENTKTNRQLISYELDSEGKIVNVDLQSAPSSDLIADQKKLILSHEVKTSSLNSGITVDGIGIGGTILFQIPNTPVLNEADCGVGSFVRSNNYNNVKMYDVGFDGVAKAALVLEAASGSGYSTTPLETYMVKEIIDAVDEDGMSGKMLVYLNGGSEVSVFIDEKATKSAFSGNTSTKTIDQLSFGDIIAFEIGRSGKIETYSVMYDHKSQNDFLGALAVGGNGVGNNRELLVFKGIARYRANNLLTLEYMSGTQKMFELFTGIDSAQLTVVNTARKSVTYEDIGKVAFTNFRTNVDGDKVVVTANRNAIKEVIIYE